MRGGDRQQGTMWSRISPEQRVPEDHPLRPIREMVNVVLKDMSPSFGRIYAREGRPSIPPERLLRALLLQLLFSVRSERQLMELKRATDHFPRRTRDSDATKLTPTDHFPRKTAGPIESGRVQFTPHTQDELSSFAKCVTPTLDGLAEHTTPPLFDVRVRLRGFAATRRVAARRSANAFGRRDA